MALLTMSQWTILLIIGYITYRFVSNLSKKKLPPGPTPLPLLGNIRDFPPNDVPEFEHWLKHKELYGPISSVTILGTTLVIVHDKDLAHHLLEQTASKTSGRPQMLFASKLCGYESIVLCQDYTRTFRHYRKVLHQALTSKELTAKFRDLHEAEVNRQLARTLEEPDRYLEHLKTTFAATTLKMVYGYSINTKGPDTLVQLVEKMMMEFSLAAAPMAWIVDIIPIFQHLPDWLPGTTFKKTAHKWRQSVQDSAYIPYRFVQRQMTDLTNSESYVSKLVQQCKNENSGVLSQEDENAIVWTAASLYGAAADTTVITLTTFTSAMVMFPDVQRRAQEEIDNVIGTDRLPAFADRDNLPYINAIVEESLRWWPIAPLSFPHTATDDIDVNFPGIPSYHIPKGTYLLPAVWWFLHDPDVYKNPESFEPERFLSPRNEPSPNSSFGYGRRVCAGRDFAISSIYINVVQTLATFNLRKAVDKDGGEIEVNVRPKPGVLSYWTEFQFQATPRSPQHVELIQQAGRKNPPEESDPGLLRY